MLLRSYRDGFDPKDGDGWLPTGDLGELVGGRLHVHGRRGDMIITGGENVWPTPVERVLATHPAVREVAVVGRPDPRSEEHTSELQSLMRISYAVFCLTKTKQKHTLSKLHR